MNQLVCGECGGIHNYEGERIQYLHDMLDMCPPCRIKHHEQLTSLQARNAKLEEVARAAKKFLEHKEKHWQENCYSCEETDFLEKALEALDK